MISLPSKKALKSIKNLSRNSHHSFLTNAPSHISSSESSEAEVALSVLTPSDSDAEPSDSESLSSSTAGAERVRS